MTAPKYGLDISSNMMDTYQKGNNYTVNGTCSRCGACCTHHLMVTKKEEKTIRDYIKQHPIKPIHHGTPTKDSGSIDLVCPFLNDKGMIMSCTIYPVRPIICRIYKCDLSEEESSALLDAELKKGNLTLMDISHEINVPSTFFPDEYLPKHGDIVVINQLHMMEFLQHTDDIFYVTGKTRHKNGHNEVFLEHIADTNKNIWFDIMGLTKLELP